MVRRRRGWFPLVWLVGCALGLPALGLACLSETDAPVKQGTANPEAGADGGKDALGPSAADAGRDSTGDPGLDGARDANQDGSGGHSSGDADGSSTGSDGSAGLDGASADSAADGPGQDTGGGSGNCPSDRYTIVDPGKSCGDGSGQVRDKTTGLVWMRSYKHDVTYLDARKFCLTAAMRLPTKDEALGIAGTNRDRCVFPCAWYTWTLLDAETDLSWQVASDGNSAQYHTGSIRIGGLCVR